LSLAAGCAGPQPAPPTPDVALPPAAPVISIPSPVPSEESKTGEQQTALAPPPAPPRPAVAHLLALAPRQISGIFGQPSLVRREPPAEVWQYANHGCVLILFFYPDPAAADQPLRVTRAELLGRDRRGPLPESECLEGLIKPGVVFRPKA
jgi:hypothetical protein